MFDNTFTPETFLPIDNTDITFTPFELNMLQSLRNDVPGIDFYDGSVTGTANSMGVHGMVTNIYSGSLFSIDGQKFPTHLFNKVRVLSITKDFYGDKIKEGTLAIQDNFYSPIVVNLYDDGMGNLWDSDYSGSFGFYQFSGQSDGPWFQSLTVDSYLDPLKYDFMIEGYVYNQNNNGSESIIFSHKDGTTGYELAIVTGSSVLTSSLTYLLGDGTSYTPARVDTSGSLSMSQWTHFAMIFERYGVGSSSIYINGTCSAVSSSIGNVTGSISNIYSTSIAGTNLVAGDVLRRFNGNISYLRYYSFPPHYLGSIRSQMSQYLGNNIATSNCQYPLKWYMREEFAFKNSSLPLSSGGLSLSILSGASTSPVFYRSANPVGNIFYGQGFVAITETDPYIKLGSGSYGGGFGSSIQFKSAVKKTEMRVECHASANDLLFSQNPSAVYQDDHDSGSSYNNIFRNNPFQAYATAVGLYSNDGDLVAVAKLAEPIPRMQEFETTFVLRMDL
jgi:hypothetical protein